MTNFKLKFTLKSDATFGRGDGIASLIDSEVQHDEYGLPFLGGRSLKGLLEEECANIIFALEKQGKDGEFKRAAQHLFGNPGSRDSDKAILHVGDARLDDDLRKAAALEVDGKKMEREDVLNSLTAIRNQTAMDEESGAPKEKSLRSMRVVLRGTPFEAELSFTKPPTDMDLPLLATCIKAFRRAGTGRNRGRGELDGVKLCDAAGDDITDKQFYIFQEEVMK